VVLYPSLGLCVPSLEAPEFAAGTALVSGGVFDRHPGLRVAFLEAGVGWVPFFIDLRTRPDVGEGSARK
jgi:hypothetical protein